MNHGPAYWAPKALLYAAERDAALAEVERMRRRWERAMQDGDEQAVQRIELHGQILDLVTERDAALARVAELSEAIGELFILDVGRSTQGQAWVKVDQGGFDHMRAARDAAVRAQRESVESRCDCDPNDLERWHCPACKRCVAGVLNHCRHCGSGRHA